MWNQHWQAGSLTFYGLNKIFIFATFQPSIKYFIIEYNTQKGRRSYAVQKMWKKQFGQQ